MSNVGVVSYMVKLISSCGLGIMCCNVLINSLELFIWNSLSNVVVVLVLLLNGVNVLLVVVFSIYVKLIDDKNIGNMNVSVFVWLCSISIRLLVIINVVMLMIKD